MRRCKALMTSLKRWPTSLRCCRARLVAAAIAGCRRMPPGERNACVAARLPAGSIPALPTYMTPTLETHWKVLLNVDSGVTNAIGSLFNEETGKSFIRTLGGRTNFDFAPQTLTCKSRFYDLLREVATELGFEGRKFPFRHSVQQGEINLRFRLYQGILAIEVVRSAIDVSQSDNLIEKTSLWSNEPLADLILNILGLIKFPQRGFRTISQKPKVFTCSRIVADATNLPTIEDLVGLLTRHSTAANEMVSQVLTKNQDLKSDSSTLLVDRQGVVVAMPASLASDKTTSRRFPAAANMLELLACVQRMTENQSLSVMPKRQLNALSNWFEDPEDRFRFSTSSLRIWQCLCKEFGLTPQRWTKLINEIEMTTSKPLPAAAALHGGDSMQISALTNEGRSSKSDSEETNQVDFAIITFRDDELDAVLKFFQPYHQRKGVRRSYSVASVTTKSGRALKIAVLRSHEQGHGAAQAAATDVIFDQNPRWLMLVGIAGAVPESEFSLGDVIVAGRICDFSVTAALSDGSREYAAHSAPAHKAVQDLVSRFVPLKSQIGEWGTKAKIGVDRPIVVLTEDKFVGAAEWKEKTKKALQASFGSSGEEIRRLPNVTSAAIGSGNMLQKDPDLLKEWLSFSRDLKAVEMELPGVYEAARDIQGDRPVLAIRGISDIVGFKRSPEWTAYACLTAASFAHALIVSDAIE